MVTLTANRRLTGRQHDLQRDLVRLVLAEGFAHLTVEDVARRLSCSKRTLYALADSKEQLAVVAVRQFFRDATEQVEQAISRTRSPARRVTRYLEAVADALRPASRQFFDDVDANAGTREVYDRNTAAAARRVSELIADGARAGAFRSVRTSFVADVVSSTMTRIASGEVEAATGLDDADAYAELARLLLAAVSRS